MARKDQYIVRSTMQICVSLVTLNKIDRLLFVEIKCFYNLQCICTRFICTIFIIIYVKNFCIYMSISDKNCPGDLNKSCLRDLVSSIK